MPLASLAPFELLHARLPDLAEAETRVVTVLEDIAMLQGPELNGDSPQSGHAEAILQLFIDTLLDGLGWWTFGGNCRRLPTPNLLLISPKLGNRT